MADRAKLQEEIKCQGEIVRKLKAEKAEKDKVSINLLEKLLSSIQTKMGLIFYELVCESDHMFAIHVDPRPGLTVHRKWFNSLKHAVKIANYVYLPSLMCCISKDYVISIQL